MITREQWLKERRNHIGASDVAAILGVDPRRGPLDIYAAKIGELEDSYDNDWLRFGRDVEGAIANLYATRTGRLVRDLGATEISRHPDIAWIGATLDREVYLNTREGVISAQKELEIQLGRDPLASDLGGPLELKHVGNYRRPNEWQAEPPAHYQVQLQIQMACTAATWGSLAGMFPGYQLAYRDFLRDDEFLGLAYPVLDEFWQRVQRRDPPPVESHRCLDVVKRLYPQEDGETIELNHADSDLAIAWEQAKKIKGTAEKEAKELEAKLRQRIGSATFGTLTDGRTLTLKTTKRAAYTKTVEACEYRTLRIKKG